MQTKARSTTQAIAANRLRDGVPVWFGRTGSWVERVEEAAVFGAEAITAALAAARASGGGNQVVDMYAIDVELRDSGPAPLHMRERMKARGPSVDVGRIHPANVAA